MKQNKLQLQLTEEMTVSHLTAPRNLGGGLGDEGSWNYGTLCPSGSWTQALELRKTVKAKERQMFTLSEQILVQKEKPQRGVGFFFQLEINSLRKRSESKRWVAKEIKEYVIVPPKANRIQQDYIK